MAATLSTLGISVPVSSEELQQPHLTVEEQSNLPELAWTGEGAEVIITVKLRGIRVRVILILSCFEELKSRFRFKILQVLLSEISQVLHKV